jgi:hypothetical protein
MINSVSGWFRYRHTKQHLFPTEINLKKAKIWPVKILPAASKNVYLGLGNVQ